MFTWWWQLYSLASPAACDYPSVATLTLYIAFHDVPKESCTACMAVGDRYRVCLCVSRGANNPNRAVCACLMVLNRQYTIQLIQLTQQHSGLGYISAVGNPRLAFFPSMHASFHISTNASQHGFAYVLYAGCIRLCFPSTLHQPNNMFFKSAPHLPVSPWA